MAAYGSGIYGLIKLGDTCYDLPVSRLTSQTFWTEPLAKKCRRIASHCSSRGDEAAIANRNGQFWVNGSARVLVAAWEFLSLVTPPAEGLLQPSLANRSQQFRLDRLHCDRPHTARYFFGCALNAFTIIAIKIEIPPCHPGILYEAE